MQVAIKRQPGSKVAMTITLEPSGLEQQKEKLFQKYARRVKIPGFRPGKAPRRLLEEYINPQQLQQEAIEALIDRSYKEALFETNLEPLERGDIDDVSVADDLTVTYTVVVSVLPEIKLGEYRGIEIIKPVTEITESQVETEIENLRLQTSDYCEIADDGIQTGDYVTIDYTMTLDGEPYPQGDVSGYPLEIGSDTLFTELNTGLLGIKQDETTKITTSYAADYSNHDLAGKPAEFEITVQQVRRMVKPDANDEWAQMISKGALSTIDELRARIHKNLLAMAARSDNDEMRNKLVSKVLADAELEIPETLAEEEFKHLMHDLEHRLNEKRMTIDELAEETDRTVTNVRDEQLLRARDLVRRSLVMQEIARREDLFVNDEDIEAMLRLLAPEGETPVSLRKELEKSGRFNPLVSRLFQEKVFTFLENNAKIITDEVTGTPTITTPEETTLESAE